jgi:hypothetical protein
MLTQEDVSFKKFCLLPTDHSRDVKNLLRPSIRTQEGEISAVLGNKIEILYLQRRRSIFF